LIGPKSTWEIDLVFDREWKMLWPDEKKIRLEIASKFKFEENQDNKRGVLTGYPGRI
jgi:hypothetical protein